MDSHLVLLFPLIPFAHLTYVAYNNNEVALFRMLLALMLVVITFVAMQELKGVYCACCETRMPKFCMFFHLVNHIDHSTVYSCAICEQRFTSPHDFQTHMKDHGQSPHKCCECNAHFDTRRATCQHFRAAHTQISSICCYCDVQFNSQQELARHKIQHR